MRRAFAEVKENSRGSRGADRRFNWSAIAPIAQFEFGVRGEFEIATSDAKSAAQEWNTIDEEMDKTWQHFGAFPATATRLK